MPSEEVIPQMEAARRARAHGLGSVAGPRDAKCAGEARQVRDRSGDVFSGPLRRAGLGVNAEDIEGALLAIDGCVDPADQSFPHRIGSE